MRELIRSTTAYRAIAREGADGFSQTALIVSPDGKYLREFLKECAKGFFGSAGSARRDSLIERESFSDCLIFPAPEKKLAADDCAMIMKECLLQPVEERRKLFLLDGFHTTTALVQNKLLKILEEPPAHTAFLLGAETEYSILPTVLSRVKKYSIPPFSEEKITEALARKYPEERGLEEAAAASGGIFSVAENLFLDGGKDFALAEQFLSLEEGEKFCRENGEYKNKREFFSALKAILRDMLFLETGQGKNAKLNRPQTKKLAAMYSAGAVIAAIELVEEAEKQIQFNANFANCLYALHLGVKERKERWKKWS